MKMTKVEIVQKIKSAAKEYKSKLLGKTFLYVYENGSLEVSFRKAEFAHLTGTERKISAESFFKLAESGKLTAKQIYFTPSHPFDLCKKKVMELENLPKVVETEAFVLENIGTKTAVFKFGFTELNFTLCLCEDINASGDKQSDYYLPQSFRIEDCFDRASNVYEIQAILEKKNTEKLYNVIRYQDKKKYELPDTARAKIAEDVLAKLNLAE